MPSTCTLRATGCQFRYMPLLIAPCSIQIASRKVQGAIAWSKALITGSWHPHTISYKPLATFFKLCTRHHKHMTMIHTETCGAEICICQQQHCFFCYQDVAVSVVGKYCYHMHSPAEHQTLPVIVDIILVGRTKIITLHSSIWLTNSTDRHVAFRLHVPITPLVAPARVGPPNRKQQTTDHVIGPLEPNAGEHPFKKHACSPA